MRRTEVKRQLDEGDLAALSPLLDATEKDDIAQAYATVLAWDGDHGDHGDRRPVAFAQVNRGRNGWALAYGGHADAVLVQTAVDVVRQAGGGHTHMWVNRPNDADDALARAAGLSRGRDLYQMRRPLPADEDYELETRPFVVGRDDEAWLTVNNRAFHSHPEQGGWDLATLQARQREPWFDSDGFLLHEVDGRLAGFCWTKVHADHDPPLGEIYVIATDPDFQGRGLGRRLVLAGLDHLARKGLTVGMLYVDAANAPAVHLYKDMGFEVDHVDRAYVGDIPPAPFEG